MEIVLVSRAWDGPAPLVERAEDEEEEEEEEEG